MFARYRQGLCCESDRVCHVLSVPGGSPVPRNPVPRTLVSLCGQDFPPGVLELMPQWAGMPCVPCTLLLPDQTGPDVADPRAIAGAGPAGDAIPEGYVGGAAFSGEALRHLVPKSTQRCRSAGRAVAVSECGHLAYDGDDGSPDDWPVCSECADRAAGNGNALWRMPRQRPGESSEVPRVEDGKVEDGKAEDGKAEGGP